MLGLTTDEIEAHFAGNAKRFLAKMRGGLRRLLGLDSARRELI